MRLRLPDEVKRGDKSNANKELDRLRPAGQAPRELDFNIREKEEVKKSFTVPGCSVIHKHRKVRPEFEGY